MDNIYKILESLNQVEEERNEDEGVEEAMGDITPIDHSDDEDGASVEDISSAITRRLMAHPKFGALVREIDIIDLNDAIEDVAQFHAGGDLGTSDVSGMVNDVLKQLKKEGALDESEVKEEEVEENAFNQAAAAAARAGKKEFEFGGKTHPVKMDKATAHKLDDDINEDYDKDEYDEEGEMVKSQARTIEDAAKELQEILDDDENLPEWVQKKVTLAKDYVDTARDYLKANPSTVELDIAEGTKDAPGKHQEKIAKDTVRNPDKALLGGPDADEAEEILRNKFGYSDKQIAKLKETDELEESDLMKKLRKFMANPGKEFNKLASFSKDTTGSPKDMQDAIRKMSDKELLSLRGTDKEKAKALSGGALSAQLKMIDREIRRRDSDKSGETNETTVAGAVATGADATGSNIYGNPSVYESMNSSVENMITESMNVSVNSSNDPSAEPSVTVSATGEDAMALAQLLQLAAVNKPKTMKVCKHCGDQMGKPEHMDCPYDNRDPMGENFMEVACEDEEANSANNTETYDMKYLLDTLSGGLNGPKRQINPNNPGDNPMAMDGNKTVNVEESEDVGVSHLEALYQEFKTR